MFPKSWPLSPQVAHKLIHRVLLSILGHKRKLCPHNLLMDVPLGPTPTTKGSCELCLHSPLVHIPLSLILIPRGNHNSNSHCPLVPLPLSLVLIA